MSDASRLRRQLRKGAALASASAPTERQLQATAQEVQMTDARNAQIENSASGLVPHALTIFQLHPGVPHYADLTQAARDYLVARFSVGAARLHTLLELDDDDDDDDDNDGGAGDAHPFGAV